MLSDIFSIPFLICLAISVLLIGCSSIYFYQRIMQQDHKIASMVSLISSVTEELKGGSQSHSLAPAPLPASEQAQPHIVPFQSKLIVVSDGEESDTDSESDSEDSSAYSETSEEEDLGDLEDDDTLRGEELIEELNIISSSLQMDEELQLQSNEIHASDEVLQLGEELSFEEISETVPLEEASSEIRSIHLDEPLTDLSLFKNIHISGSDVSADSSALDESANYKKMPIQKLREIAQMQGHGDTSKLKKNEILKLLGVE